MPAKRTRGARKRQQPTTGGEQEMTRKAGGRRRKARSARAASGRTGRARIARTNASRAGRLIAEARDMAQSVGTTTLHAAAGVANRTQETASAVAGQVWDNKWPALLIGAGTTWLVVDAVRGRSNDGAARTPSRGRSSNLAKQAASTVADAGRGVGRFVRDNPVLAGATTLGVGLAVGLTLPSTSAEDTLLGSARDAVVERAKDAARGTVRNVRNAAQNMAGRK